MHWRSALVGAALLTTSDSFAQAPLTLEQLLDRMGAYLLEYETRLSSVVADERFEQRVLARTASADGRPGSKIVQKVIESEIAFIRLPGGAEWLSFRDVRKVDGQRSAATAIDLPGLLASGASGVNQAKTMALAGAAHNLGLFRTINFPTMPLEILHPSHRQAFRHWIDGKEVVRNMSTTIVGFEETARPTIVRQPDATNLVSRGKVWVETATGRIPRIEWVYVIQRPASVGVVLPPSLRVEFAMHDGLGILVPTKMRENFSTSMPQNNGSGEATYTNFRRFGTSAKIVPQ